MVEMMDQVLRNNNYVTEKNRQRLVAVNSVKQLKTQGLFQYEKALGFFMRRK